ncbi:hypothetical protein T440DRAFT_467409 [Plenodomus tracheiphilus IPT5]|uniref:Uncharacterized protein n=1 Tax=Plenodomus tracheiphilus IPT5 TaxID=1408161 RepID=A0A6A7B8F7_9PLEO|nr:hypothetical protein T440DRAFT_467409 [Plenodomus tracheiphilus IPT5]
MQRRGLCLLCGQQTPARLHVPADFVNMWVWYTHTRTSSKRLVLRTMSAYSRLAQRICCVAILAAYNHAKHTASSIDR